MNDSEQVPIREQLIDFILNLTDEEAEKIIAFLQETEKEQN